MSEPQDDRHGDAEKKRTASPVQSKEAGGPSASTLQVSNDQRIRQPHPHDVLCGRGPRFNLRHPGNKMFRKMILEHKEEYCMANERKVKAEITQSILNQIASLQPPGRFLVKDEDNPADRGKILTTEDGEWIGCWREATSSQAFVKTSQALREGAPKLRMKLERQMEGRKRPPEEDKPFHDSNQIDSQPNVSIKRGPARPEIHDLKKPKVARVTKGNIAGGAALNVDEIIPEPIRGNKSPEISNQVMLEFLQPLLSPKQPCQEQSSKPSPNWQNIPQSQHQYRTDQTQQNFPPTHQEPYLYRQNQPLQHQSHERSISALPTQAYEGTQAKQTLSMEVVSKPSFRDRPRTMGLNLDSGRPHQLSEAIRAQESYQQQETSSSVSYQSVKVSQHDRDAPEEAPQKDQNTSSKHAHGKFEDTTDKGDHLKPPPEPRGEGGSSEKKFCCDLRAAGIECNCAVGLGRGLADSFDDY